MKLCRRALESVQIINDKGDVRICGWQYDGGIIGNLLTQSMKEIYNGNHAKLIRQHHADQDYSHCNPNDCPYVATNTVDEIAVEIDEAPELPTKLLLAYENACNYQCVMCTIPGCLTGKDLQEREKRLDKIDDEVRKVMPYITEISANGLGELFASPHILKLLSEWKPLADPSECKASLETNGSLFTPANWEKISNLGQYHLSVTITVLSFDEEVYQELSGTKLPIQTILDNLHFVKKLREEGIINFFAIATVYQAKNFRALPEFTRRAIEEFGADYVRLRPYQPWREPDMQEWFRDVRNVYHPYHQEFLEVMKDPIFQHPKVHDWGGGNESNLGPEPYPWLRKRYYCMEKIFCDKNFLPRLKEATNGKPIVIYAMGIVGKALFAAVHDEIEILYCIDRAMDGESYCGVPIYSPNRLKDVSKNAIVVVTMVRNDESVIELMKAEGYEGVIPLTEFID